MISEIYSFLTSLRKKTIRAKTGKRWTPPMIIHGVGHKRIDFEVLGVGRYHFKPKNFIDLIFDGIEYMDDSKVAKYVLSSEEQQLLDV